jgi:outer membrane protein OmpA-like peptidoglycan-associated protein
MMNIRKAAPAVVLLIPLTLSACASLNNTEKGAIIGAAGGAAVGGAVGKATGSTARGAIIGAAVGGVAGAVIGRQMDQQAEELAADLEGADVERVGEGILINFPSGLLFDFDSSNLRSASRADLADLASSFGKYEGRELMIVGHTDATGTDSYNMNLSRQRAQATADYLMSQGIPSSRIRVVGRGEEEPVASNDSAEGRQLNRRVEIAVFATEEYRQQVESEQGL